MSIESQTTIYTDFARLAQMRTDAKADPAKNTREVAKQFEALFVQMMMKSMRNAMKSFNSSLSSSQTMRIYQDMFDKQLSVEMANKQGVGLADMMIKDLTQKGLVKSGQSDKAKEDAAKTITVNKQDYSCNCNPLSHVKSLQNGFEINQIKKPQPIAINAVEKQAEKAIAEAVKTIPVNSDKSTEKFTPFPSPRAFIKELWPHALEAAQRLGVKPEALVAQAALETRWGKSMIKHSDGSNSHNLFGIKAGRSWGKEKVYVTTHEYQGGAYRKIKAPFRSYASYADSFNDYANLLINNKRYHKAISVAHDPKQFTKALQNAGYATDPRYSKKIMSIMNGRSMQNALSEL